MQGITGLTESKRAVLAVLLILCAAVALFLGKIAWAEFEGYSLWIFVPYAGAEMVTRSVQHIVNRKGAASATPTKK